MSIFNSPAPEESEDCLYLNVFTPDAPTDGPGRAVLVWLYGGSLQFGTASREGYDGSHFAG
jgi:carboxylesterase type B